MLQQDLQAAIKSLEASTAAINRQGEILKTQQKYLDSIRDGQVEQYPVSRTKRLEAQNLALLVEESNESLMSEIRELEEGLQGQTKAAIASASHHLNHDDRWLQKLAAASALDMDDGKESKARVTSLTAKLSELTREEIQCRLNRVYLQRLMGSDQNGMLEQSELGEQELEQDLESLHVEITDVAAMSVFQDFTAPMLAALAEHQNKKNEEARSVLENISDAMTTLTEATETYVTRLEALKAFQTDISTYAKEVNTRAADFWSQVEARPQRRKPPENPMPSALSDMLHHWNVLMPENGSVEKALVARKQKLKQDVLQAGAAIEDSLRAHLDTLPTNIESPVETKAVAEKDMADLEENMHKLRQAVDAVDLGRIDSDSEAKSRFLARWAKESTVK